MCVRRADSLEPGELGWLGGWGALWSWKGPRNSRPQALALGKRQLDREGLCKAKQLVSGRPSVSLRAPSPSWLDPPPPAAAAWTKGTAACAPQGGRFHSWWASRLRHCLLGTLGCFWLEKVECGFMEIGPEVVINLAVVGYVQWLMATVFCKKLNLRVKNGRIVEWQWASLVKG